MLLFFEQDSLQLNIRIGGLEEYTPTPEVKEIIRRAEELKRKRDIFLDKTFNPEMKKLLDMIDRINITENPSLKELRKKGKKD